VAEETTSQDQRVPEPPRRRFGSRRARPAASSREGWLLLESSGWYIRLVDILDHPTTAVLASEDAAWEFCRLDWQSRRPHRWQRSARQAWRTEGQALESKRLRLVELTRQVRTLRPTRK
jgi:hypothetical protein